MAPYSSTLAWKIPRAEEPGRLQSMGSGRVGHGWATSLLLFTFMHWRRKWQPTPVFLPGESQGWGRTESDTTEVVTAAAAAAVVVSLLLSLFFFFFGLWVPPLFLSFPLFPPAQHRSLTFRVSHSLDFADCRLIVCEVCSYVFPSNWQVNQKA